MWVFPAYVLLTGLVLYLTTSTIYLGFLAIAYFIVPERVRIQPLKRCRFAIVVPAHNEELLIGVLCKSLLDIRYNQELFEIFVIADNCFDATAEICRSFAVSVLERNEPALGGKGHAISWALDKIDLDGFDALLVVDADNYVDPAILEELNLLVENGEQAIQCYNTVGNRRDSWFTQLLFVTRTMGNLLYHHSKYKLGLSSYLMGNGICFSTTLLKRKGWTAFTVGEDWEYYAQLIKDRIKVGFAARAKVYHQESRSLEQATSQRLRWSSGRFLVLRKFGLPLFWKGLSKRDWFTLDASLPLFFPNYSLQINLTMLALLVAILLPALYMKLCLLVLCSVLFVVQVLLFLAGAYLAKSYWEVLKAVLRAPLFLAWKAVIDFLSVTRLYRAERWVRTKRHSVE